MNIVFTGTHGTGKTTLLNILREQTHLPLIFDFVTETARSLKKEDKAKINEDGDDASQFAIALKNYEIYINHKNFISDRCLLDVLCYTRYLYLHNKVSLDALHFIETLFKQVRYDVLFYIEPEFQLIGDGTRSLNIEFRDGVKECFNYYIKHWNIPVVRLSGTIDERLKTIKETLTDKFNLLF